MIDDESAGELDGPEPDESQDLIELTPAQTVSLRSAVANIQRAIQPQIESPKFTVPESMLNNFAAVSGIVESQRTLMSSAIGPLLDTQAKWAAVLQQQTMSRFTSDLIKGMAPFQSALSIVGAQLTKRLDLGFAQSVASIIETFTAQRSAWLRDLGPTFAAIRSSTYPPNLRAIEDLKFSDVEVVVMVDGIALYGLPRTATAQALLRADGAAKRREVLGRRWKTISADCRAAVEGCTSAAVASYLPFASAALDALDGGHVAAAQALSGSLIDAIVAGYFGNDRYQLTPNSKTLTTDAYDDFTVREFVAFAPLWQSYQQFRVKNGDKAPATFNRNATAHTVSPRQFNRRNAIQGLMFACSLLYRLDEEAVANASVA